MLTPSPATLVAQLVALLDLEQLAPDRYRGARRIDGVGRVFGGQVVAQALQAAQRAVDPPKAAHSLHANFLRGGDEQQPIEFHVTRPFDGRSFATRYVVATQHDRPILTLTASFQLPEEGLAHQAATMPDVPPPEDLRSDAEILAEHADELPETVRRFMLRPRPLDVRPVDTGNWLDARPRAPWQANWFRVPAPLADDPALHRAVLAYLSDMKLLATGMRPHGYGFLSRRLTSASLDHAIWFHDAFRADDWLLYVNDSPWSGHARAFNRGEVFARDGRLVASVAQEGLIRLAQKPD